MLSGTAPTRAFSPPRELDQRARAELLIQCAQLLGSNRDVAGVVDALAARVRALLNAVAVVVLLGEEDDFQVAGISAESNQVVERVRSEQGRISCRKSLRLARRAERKGAPITVTIKAANLPDLPAGYGEGELLIAPLRTSHSLGALLVYSRADGEGRGRDASRVGAKASRGAISLPDVDHLRDVDRAQALGGEISVVLEATQNLHEAEQDRRRADALMQLALELNSSLRLPQFVANFTQRAAQILDARSAVLALAQHARLETVIFQDPSTPRDSELLRRLNQALSWLVTRNVEQICCSTAAELLGDELAGQLGWNDLTVTRMTGGDGELLGVLCLANRGVALSGADRNLLQALAGHAAVALENSRLFTRVEQANRHWIEIFDSISDFIVVHDESNYVLRVNRSLADLIGVRPSELIGVSMRALVSMSADADHACPFCRTGLGATDEYIHPVLERTYLVSTSLIHGAANDGLQTIHVLKDISDRREAERRYRELFDNIQEGLFFSSPEGRFVEVNDALVRMLGYGSREELLQVDIAGTLYTSPEHRLRYEQAIQETGTLRNYEDVLRRKDGTLVYVLQNAFAVRDSLGRVVQYRGLMLDITELKTFAAELQRERDFSGKILNNTQSLILVSDTAGLISYANRRCFEAGGYQESNLLGRRLIDLVLVTRRETMAQALQSILSGQQVDNLELPILLGSGRTAPFSVNLSPMRDEQGNVTSIVVVMTDITDAALLQAKLMHTEKMAAVGQLVSGVAHEVNNPLTAVLGFADLLLEDKSIPERARKDLQVIMNEAQRTKQIVQNLLSFARQMPPERHPIRVNEILRRTLSLRSYDFANHDVQVLESFGEIPDLVGDAHQLQQVFLNIVNNAYDAVRETGQPGRIEIETRHRGESVEICFRDNGPGIQNPDRIFDPFFTTKEVGKGTGLGLSICYGIVHEHGGEITCQNNPGAPGATFLVSLPLQGAERGRPAAAQSPQRTNSGLVGGPESPQRTNSGLVGGPEGVN